MFWTPRRPSSVKFFTIRSERINDLEVRGLKVAEREQFTRGCVPALVFSALRDPVQIDTEVVLASQRAKVTIANIGPRTVQAIVRIVWATSQD